MNTYVALFRGINVGGRNILPMSELRRILGELGLQDVRTYIQSGNAVFRGETRPVSAPGRPAPAASAPGGPAPAESPPAESPSAKAPSAKASLSKRSLAESPSAESSLVKRIGDAIEERHGFRPDVMLLRIEELEEAIRQNPFPDAEAQPRTLHLGFLASVPRKPDLKSLEEVRKVTERIRLEGAVFYLHAPDGIGRSKLAATAEEALGVPMTMRNWRTVSRIRSMAEET